jgi:hypothetical protein
VSACRFHSNSVTEINRHRRSFSGTPKLQRNHLEGKIFFAEHLAALQILAVCQYPDSSDSIESVVPLLCDWHPFESTLY